MNRKLIFTSLLAGTLLVSSSVVKAQEDALIGGNNKAGNAPEQLLKAPIQNADYAFQGVVTKVEYRLSEGVPQLPHTFVTFKVEKSLKGTVNQQFVTLRFMGGTDGKGNFLSVSGLPLFDVGDRDTLLVRGNGKAGCPLVGCASGRFRIINNLVFTDDGKPILQTPQGRLIYGAPQALNQVLTNKIGDVVVKDVYRNPASDRGSGVDALSAGQSFAPALEQSVPSSPLPSSQLEILIKNQVSQLSLSPQLQPRPFAFSVDSNAKFAIGSLAPVAPPRIAPPTVKPAIAPANEAERRELELLQRNGGNPVFPNSKPRLR
jgi:hypothetical protein